VKRMISLMVAKMMPTRTALVPGMMFWSRSVCQSMLKTMLRMLVLFGYLKTVVETMSMSTMFYPSLGL
jgi:hypothetical protein